MYMSVTAVRIWAINRNPYEAVIVYSTYVCLYCASCGLDSYCFPWGVR